MSSDRLSAEDNMLVCIASMHAPPTTAYLSISPFDSPYPQTAKALVVLEKMECDGLVKSEPCQEMHLVHSKLAWSLTEKGKARARLFFTMWELEK